MKKILFVFPFVVLLAVGCNSQPNITSNTQPNETDIQNSLAAPTPTSTPVPTDKPLVTSTLKPTMQSGGFLAATTGGQLYTNQDMGIQIVVPSGWTLGKIANKNSVSFQNNEAARKYYEQNTTAFQNVTMDEFVSGDTILYIQYFKNFSSYKATIWAGDFPRLQAITSV
jgi:hypothetical protein